MYDILITNAFTWLSRLLRIPPADDIWSKARSKHHLALIVDAGTYFIITPVKIAISRLTDYFWKCD